MTAPLATEVREEAHRVQKGSEIFVSPSGTSAGFTEAHNEEGAIRMDLLTKSKVSIPRQRITAQSLMSVVITEVEECTSPIMRVMQTGSDDKQVELMPIKVLMSDDTSKSMSG